MDGQAPRRPSHSHATHSLWVDEDANDEAMIAADQRDLVLERCPPAVWTLEEELYAQDFLFKCSKRLVLHQTAYYHFQRLHYCVSVPALVLGGVASTVAFSNVSQTVLCADISWAMLVIGILSALSAIFSGYSAHVVDYKQEMLKHEEAYLNFQRLVRELSAELYAPGMRGPYRATMRKAIDAYNRYTDDAKILPSRVNDSVNRRLRADTEYETAAAAAAAADEDRWRAHAHLVQMSPDVDYRLSPLHVSGTMAAAARAPPPDLPASQSGSPVTSGSQTTDESGSSASSSSSSSSSANSSSPATGGRRRSSLLGALFRSRETAAGPGAAATTLRAAAAATYRAPPSVQTRMAQRRCTLQSANLPATVQFELYTPSYVPGGRATTPLTFDTPHVSISGSSPTSSSPAYPAAPTSRGAPLHHDTPPPSPPPPPPLPPSATMAPLDDTSSRRNIIHNESDSE